MHLEGTLACLGGVLGRLGVILGSLWVSWAVLGSLLPCLGVILGAFERFGTSWGRFGVVYDIFLVDFVSSG